MWKEMEAWAFMPRENILMRRWNKKADEKKMRTKW